MHTVILLIEQTACQQRGLLPTHPWGEYKYCMPGNLVTFTRAGEQSYDCSPRTSLDQCICGRVLQSLDRAQQSTGFLEQLRDMSWPDGHWHCPTSCSSAVAAMRCLIRMCQMMHVLKVSANTQDLPCTSRHEGRQAIEKHSFGTLSWTHLSARSVW